MSIRRPQVRWRAGSRALLLAGVGLVVVIALVVRPGTSPLIGASPAASSGVDSPPASPPDIAAGRSFIVEADGGFIAAKVGGPSLRIPAGENLLAVSDDYAASVLSTGDAGSALVIREISTGRKLARLDRREQIATAVFAGGSLYFNGYPVTLGDQTDTGVSAIDLTSLDVREVIAPAPWPADWGGDGSGIRNQLRVSPTGHTVGAPACGPVLVRPQHCFIDLIDVASQTVTRPITDTSLYLWDISDTILFVAPDGVPFVEALDGTTGGLRWQTDEALGGFFSHYLTRDGEALVVSYVKAANVVAVVAGVDLANGAIRIVREEPGDSDLWLWPELSDGSYAVVGHGDELRSVFGTGLSAASADLVDLVTGDVTPNALTIQSPAAVP